MKSTTRRVLLVLSVLVLLIGGTAAVVAVAGNQFGSGGFDYVYDPDTGRLPYIEVPARWVSGDDGCKYFYEPDTDELIAVYDPNTFSYTYLSLDDDSIVPDGFGYIFSEGVLNIYVETDSPGSVSGPMTYEEMVAKYAQECGITYEEALEDFNTPGPALPAR